MQGQRGGGGVGVWVGVVQVVDQGKLVEAQAVEPVVYNPDTLWA